MCTRDLPVQAGTGRSLGLAVLQHKQTKYISSDFGAGNKMIDLYVILAMPFISFLVVVIYIIEIPS